MRQSATPPRGQGMSSNEENTGTAFQAAVGKLFQEANRNEEEKKTREEEKNK
jgi:hypothetical protein